MRHTIPFLVVAAVACGTHPSSVEVDESPTSLGSELAGVSTLLADGDTFARDGSPSTVYGSKTVLEAKQFSSNWNRMTFVQFPAGNVTSALAQVKLRLYGHYSQTAVVVAAVGVSPAWSEATLTWANRPSSSGPTIATQTINSATPRWYEWDVTPYVQAQKAAGQQRVAFALKSLTYGNGLASFTSKEAGANAPQLVATEPSANQPPSVARVAQVSSNPVTGTTATLSVLGADDAGEAGLTYTRSAAAGAPAPVTWSSNGTNQAKSTIATFSKGGAYSAQVTIRDAAGATVTSSVAFTVAQTPPPSGPPVYDYVTVGNCASLPPVGVWQKINSAGSDAIVVDRFNAAVVWLGGNRNSGQGLQKSTDCGSTWQYVNTGVNGASINGDQWSVAMDPEREGVLYVLSAYGSEGLWKSNNGGRDWRQMLPPGSEFAQAVYANFVNNVSMDPYNSLHLVVTSHGSCRAPLTKGCLTESFDGGETWGPLKETPDAWGEGGGLQIIRPDVWIWGGAQTNGGLFTTTDGGDHWTQERQWGQGNANGEFSLRPLVPASDGAYYISSLDGALRSTDGVHWTLASHHSLVVGITTSHTHVYVSEQWGQGRIFRAPLPATRHEQWTEISRPGPPCPWLDFDRAHNILYASRFTDGAFRMVVAP